MAEQHAPFISAETMSALSEYQATGKESDRVKALSCASNLVRDLDKPGDYIFKVFFSPSILTCIKVAHDLGIFSALSGATSPVSCQQLAASKNADVVLVQRIMRVVAAGGFAREDGPGRYSSTKLSEQMLHQGAVGLMESMFLDFLPIFHGIPEFLQQTGYRNPGDPLKGPFQHAHNTPLSCWDWMVENKPAADRFNTFMEGNRGNIPHWAEWFPVQEVLLNGAVPDGPPLLVDLGGGLGHDIVGFKARFPCGKGQLVLEDLPAVIAANPGLGEEIQLVPHDFFTPQPVKGARAYYFKHILHDWSDENCRAILKHISNVMERGYSKLLIDEYILPEENCSPRHAMIDMGVMAWCTGLERTRQQWSDLLRSAGLVVRDFWTPTADGSGIIEAELQPLPSDVTAGDA